jgi:hypothetical protein
VVAAVQAKRKKDMEARDYGDDARVGGEHAEGLFKDLRQLVLDLKKADDAVLAAEEALRRARHASAELRERRIPALMERMGMEQCAYGDIEVELEAKVHASLPSADKDPDRRAAALTWFVEHGCARLIKNEFSVPLGAGENDEATYLTDLLKQAGLDFERKVTIHPQTLLAWVRERLRDGGDLPTELLGIHEQRLAKIKIR